MIAGVALSTGKTGNALSGAGLVSPAPLANPHPKTLHRPERTYPQ